MQTAPEAPPETLDPTRRAVRLVGPQPQTAR
jgi:hypothetical protein